MAINFDYDAFKNMSCGNFINYFFSLSGNEISLLALGLGYLLSANLDTNKQNSLGNFFELIGQLLLTISAQNMVIESPINHMKLQAEINELKKEIERLKRTTL